MRTSSTVGGRLSKHLAEVFESWLSKHGRNADKKVAKDDSCEMEMQPLQRALSREEISSQTLIASKALTLLILSQSSPVLPLVEVQSRPHHRVHSVATVSNVNWQTIIVLEMLAELVINLQLHQLWTILTHYR